MTTVLYCIDVEMPNTSNKALKDLDLDLSALSKNVALFHAAFITGCCGAVTSLCKCSVVLKRTVL